MYEISGKIMMRILIVVNLNTGSPTVITNKNHQNLLSCCCYFNHQTASILLFFRVSCPCPFSLLYTTTVVVVVVV